MFDKTKIYRMACPMYGQVSYAINSALYEYLKDRNALFFKVLEVNEEDQVSLIESTKENEKIHLQQVRDAIGRPGLDAIFWGRDLGEKGCLEVYEDPEEILPPDELDAEKPAPSKEQVDDALKSISIASVVYRQRQQAVDNLKVALHKAEQDLQEARADFIGELVVYNTL